MEGYNADPTDAVAADFIDWRERRYFGRNTAQTVGLSLIGSDGATPIDADADVTLTWFLDAVDGSATQVFQRVALHPSTGLYEVVLTAEDTATLGSYHGLWTYALDGGDESYTVYAVVGESNPAYDQLPQAFQEVVDNVWIRFADLFDSPSGGAHLQTYYQAHWSRGRMAQLMGMGLRRLNIISQPYQTHTIDGVGGAVFPIAQWGGLLELVTYIEAVKHLRRSYLEQPEVQLSGGVSRLDRLHYFDRWGELLKEAEADLKSAQDTFKIAYMMMGTPQVLVSGGVYGRFGPTRIAGSVAARPRYWTRFSS
jgi:hypothetical protein